MKLFFRKYASPPDRPGEGRPLIVLHGLFGQSDNWNSLGKRFAAASLQVYLVDQRNHGLSPHSEEWSYEAMTGDLLRLMDDQGLAKAILLGHSMGGKSAMHFALHHCERVAGLIVADIAPKKYPASSDTVIEALLSADLDRLKSRKEVEDHLARFITDQATRQFLLKNLYWKEEGRLAWRFNLGVLSKHRHTVGDTFDTENKSCAAPALFLRGGRSEYILDADEPLIKRLFPDAKLKTIAGAGHWLHADKPEEFFREVMDFIA
ncbi:MAG: alpha/beta fold hydrolase [Bacteroidota bacterium]